MLKSGADMYEPKELVDSNCFKLVRKIAEGGMGSVFEAIQYGAEGFEKIVAFKTIHNSLSNDKEFVDMFIGEAKLVANLVHQYIVQIYQLGKVKDMYYICMEYIDGVNLQEFVQRHYEKDIELPVDLTVYIISRVCRALEYAHNKTDKYGNLLGVVHRDVSPKNIMINTEGFVKLTDFGIAKARNLMKDNEGDVLMGKAQYMSPEQAQFMQTDKRSDIFSVGIVMYEMLTHQTLFGSEQTSVILDNVVYKDIVSPEQLNPSIPEEVTHIINKALEREPDDRFQDAGDMAYELEHYMYNNKFGPTYVTLENHFRKLFPERFKDAAKTHSFRIEDFRKS